MDYREMDKERIAKRFSSAIDSYEIEAAEQKRIAGRVFGLLCDALDREKSTGSLSIAEIGCGTGFLSRLIHRHLIMESSGSTLLLNDLCAGVGDLFEGWERCRFVPGDAEEVFGGDERHRCQERDADGYTQAFDIIVSTSVIQWFEDPVRFLADCREHLKEGGILAVSSFAPDTFREIRALTGYGLNYLRAEEYAEKLGDSFRVIAAEEETSVLSFASPMDVLRHMKATGVTGVPAAERAAIAGTGIDTVPERVRRGGDFRWTKGRLADFEEEYRRRFPSSDGGVTLTYQPVYLILAK